VIPFYIKSILQKFFFAELGVLYQQHQRKNFFYKNTFGSEKLYKCSASGINENKVEILLFISRWCTLPNMVS
jgi:hypothetical protein